MAPASGQTPNSLKKMTPPASYRRPRELPSVNAVATRANQVARQLQMDDETRMMQPDEAQAELIRAKVAAATANSGQQRREKKSGKKIASRIKEVMKHGPGGKKRAQKSRGIEETPTKERVPITPYGTPYGTPTATPCDTPRSAATMQSCCSLNSSFSPADVSLRKGYPPPPRRMQQRVVVEPIPQPMPTEHSWPQLSVVPSLSDCIGITPDGLIGSLVDDAPICVSTGVSIERGQRRCINLRLRGGYESVVEAGVTSSTNLPYVGRDARWSYSSDGTLCAAGSDIVGGEGFGERDIVTIDVDTRGIPTTLRFRRNGATVRCDIPQSDGASAEGLVLSSATPLHVAIWLRGRGGIAEIAAPPRHWRSDVHFHFPTGFQHTALFTLWAMSRIGVPKEAAHCIAAYSVTVPIRAENQLRPGLDDL